MKIHHLFILALCLFSIPALSKCPTEFICTEGVMDKNGRCFACDASLSFLPCDIEQITQKCPNRFIDEADGGRSKLKCEEGLEKVGNKCLLICKEGMFRNDKGDCCSKPIPGKIGFCLGGFDWFYDPSYNLSPYWITTERAKNLICNDGILDVDGFCHPCNTERIVMQYGGQKAKEICPDRLTDECGYSRFKCYSNEEQIGKRCFRKCPEGFVRNEHNICYNSKTNEYRFTDCPRFL